MGIIIEHGMLYASELGWPIFPISLDKRPLVKSEVEGRGGRHLATTNEVTLAEWDAAFPGANIALATGRESGIVVIDIDGDEGRRNFDALIGKKIAVRPQTVEAETGGGGLHLYFRHPGFTCRSRVGVLAPKVDIRGDGASATLPPSRHRSGQLYRWLVSPFDMSPAKFPIGLISAVRDKLPCSATPRRARFVAAGPLDIGKWLDEASRAPEGQRNATLNRCAFIIGRIISERGGDEAGMLAQLTAAGVSSGLREFEARQTARSGMRAGGARRVA